MKKPYTKPTVRFVPADSKDEKDQQLLRKIEKIMKQQVQSNTSAKE